MPNLQEASPVGTPKPPISLAYRRLIREGALIFIWNGTPGGSLPISDAGQAALIADEMTALGAQGIGSKRAEKMLALLKAGGLHAIDCGGEASPGRRPDLRLVSDGRSR